MNIARRNALKGGAAVALGTALIGLAEAAPSPDAQLIAWETEIHEREAAFDREPSHTDKEIAAFCSQSAALEHRIAETEAHTAEGLAVKLRRLTRDFEWGEGAWTEHNLRTMALSLERLAGRAGA